MAEEEEKLDDDEDPEKLGSIAHYIMMHYAKKVASKISKKRNISPRQVSTAWRPILEREEKQQCRGA
jgi:hypothetical protein